MKVLIKKYKTEKEIKKLSSKDDNNSENNDNENNIITNVNPMEVIPDFIVLTTILTKNDNNTDLMKSIDIMSKNKEYIEIIYEQFFCWVFLI